MIIDTFQRIRGQSLRSERWYDQDYREMSMIKGFMDKKGVSALFVHHTNKGKDKDDPFAEIAGTNGISGAVDTMFVIKKASRHDKKASLHIAGRDVEQSEIVMSFNKNTCHWEFVGDAEKLEAEEAEFEYQSSPIVKTIKILLSSKNKWTGSAKNLLEEGEKHLHVSLAVSSQALSKQLKKLKDQLQEKDNIIYTTSPNGNAGYKHHFCCVEEGFSEDNDNDEYVEF